MADAAVLTITYMSEQLYLLTVPESRDYLQAARGRYERAKMAYDKAYEATEEAEFYMEIPKEIQWELQSSFRNLQREEKAELERLNQ